MADPNKGQKDTTKKQPNPSKLHKVTGGNDAGEFDPSASSGDGEFDPASGGSEDDGDAEELLQ